MFAEVALVRWISTEIRIFAYLNNYILLACFVGIGFGCFTSTKKAPLIVSFALLGTLVALVKLPLFISIQGARFHVLRDIPLLLSRFSDYEIWNKSPYTSSFMVAAGLCATIVLFFIVMVVFVPLGRHMGRLFEEHPHTLTAYSINLFASITGTLGFNVLAFLYSPPWVWFSIITGSLMIYDALCDPKALGRQAVLALLAVALLVCVVEKPADSLTVWTPYQKLQVLPYKNGDLNVNQGYVISVNNTGYMTLLDLSNEFIESHHVALDERNLSQYDIVYSIVDAPRNVLILGAGAGNDAAGAIRHGVPEIDAVEIDPGVYELGRRYHPEQPYAHRSVTVSIDDARSYLKKSTKKYDLIRFGMLDSHVLSSSYNNTRLDHYVYTVESFEEAKRCLNESGVIALSFSVQQKWIGLRLYYLLSAAFGTPPIVFKIPQSETYGWGGAMFIAGRHLEEVRSRINSSEILDRFVSQNAISVDSTSASVKLTTDDWPYLYLQKASIPKLHLAVMSSLIVVFISILLLQSPRLSFSQFNPPFFFLGAGFLLMEFQNISKAALLFGSTWMVTTLMISAILVCLLAANFVVRRFDIQSIRSAYTLLFVSLCVVYTTPLHVFNVLEGFFKPVVVSIFLNAPLFFAGVLFIVLFSRVQHKDAALGSNLMGAAVGGLLESLSYGVGIKMLLVVVFVLYAASLVNKTKLVALSKAS